MSNLNRRIPLRELPHFPAPSPDTESRGCGTLIIVIVGYVIFGYVTWRLIDWIAWL